MALCSDFRAHARAREIIEEFLPFHRITLGSSYCPSELLRLAGRRPFLAAFKVSIEG
jgi:hypothetical protein